MNKAYLAILPMCLASIAKADTTLTYTNGKDQVSMQMQLTNGMMRATSFNDDKSYIVYDSNTSTFSTFIKDEKKYYVMGKEQIESLSDIGAMVDKVLEKQMANIPESQREMMRGIMEKTLKTQMAKKSPKPDYSLSDATSSYNGFDCQVVTKSARSEESEFCITNYKKIGMDEAEYAVITSFQKTIEVLTQQYGKDYSMNFSSLGEFIPVQYSQAGEKGTLSEVNHDDIDSTLFAIPEGYTKIDLPF